jgi:crotonobetainyl-CoA:carnitine CoA-transferase CaiB-like acyl-CoA transferase
VMRAERQVRDAVRRRPSAHACWSAGPLAGVRVLEVSSGRPARIASMLLADLGADVVRAVDPAGPAADSETSEPLSPETVCWDRGKRLVPISASEIPAAAGRADVLIVDAAPSALPVLGWDSATLRRNHPGLVHLWMPPYGQHGEWKDLPEDPLLLASLSGAPYYYPADDDSPVASVSSQLSHVHGALGAATATAALVGRRRQGTGRAAVVTGLHAAAALMGTALIGYVGGPKMAPGRDLKGGPNWRLYQCSDGEWLFLAALTPDIFFRALEAVDRLDVMALPEVAGDWMSSWT